MIYRREWKKIEKSRFPSPFTTSSRSLTAVVLDDRLYLPSFSNRFVAPFCYFCLSFSKFPLFAILLDRHARCRLIRFEKVSSPASARNSVSVKFGPIQSYTNSSTVAYLRSNTSLE